MRTGLALPRARYGRILKESAATAAHAAAHSTTHAAAHSTTHAATTTTTAIHAAHATHAAAQAAEAAGHSALLNGNHEVGHGIDFGDEFIAGLLGRGDHQHFVLDEVGQVEEIADAPYRTILANKGFDGEHVVEAEADLRLRAEAARERRQLNSGVVASLNEQTLGQRAASALVNGMEEDLLLEPDVQEV